MAHKRPTSIFDIWFEKIKEGDILEVKKYWKTHQKTLLSVDCVDSGGFSALHLASYKGHLPIVKWLVKEGANIHLESKSKITPIFNAARFLRVDVLKFLFQKKATYSGSLKNPNLWWALIDYQFLKRNKSLKACIYQKTIEETYLNKEFQNFNQNLNETLQIIYKNLPNIENWCEDCDDIGLNFLMRCLPWLFHEQLNWVLDVLFKNKSEKEIEKILGQVYKIKNKEKKETLNLTPWSYFTYWEKHKPEWSLERIKAITKHISFDRQKSEDSNFLWDFVAYGFTNDFETLNTLLSFNFPLNQRNEWWALWKIALYARPAYFPILIKAGMEIKPNELEKAYTLMLEKKRFKAAWYLFENGQIPPLSFLDKQADHKMVQLFMERIDLDLDFFRQNHLSKNLETLLMARFEKNPQDFDVIFLEFKKEMSLLKFGEKNEFISKFLYSYPLLFLKFIKDENEKKLDILVANFCQEITLLYSQLDDIRLDGLFLKTVPFNCFFYETDTQGSIKSLLKFKKEHLNLFEKIPFSDYFLPFFDLLNVLDFWNEEKDPQKTSEMESLLQYFYKGNFQDDEGNILLSHLIHWPVDKFKKVVSWTPKEHLSLKNKEGMTCLSKMAINNDIDKMIVLYDAGLLENILDGTGRKASDYLIEESFFIFQSHIEKTKLEKLNFTKIKNQKIKHL